MKQTDWDEYWRVDPGAHLDVGPSTRSRLRVVLPLIRRYGKAGGSLLDVGCGTGMLLAESDRVASFSKLVGVDVSELPLARAKQVCPRAELLVADVCAAPLAERFDLITCMMTLDLVPDEAAAARHLSEMLLPGGHVITVVQHLSEYGSELDQRYGVRRHDRESLTRLFAGHGLRPVRLFSWGFPLFNLYYRALDVSGAGVASTENRPSRARRLLSQGVTTLLRFDDLFTWSGRGRVLFGVFQKP